MPGSSRPPLSRQRAIVITAKRSSMRFQNKNGYPLGGRNMIQRAIDLARKCDIIAARVILITDYPEEMFDLRRVEFVELPEHLAGPEIELHHPAIKYALDTVGITEHYVACLFQPNTILHGNDVKAVVTCMYHAMNNNVHSAVSDCYDPDSRVYSVFCDEVPDRETYLEQCIIFSAGGPVTDIDYPEQYIDVALRYSKLPHYTHENSKSVIEALVRCLAGNTLVHLVCSRDRGFRFDDGLVPRCVVNDCSADDDAKVVFVLPEGNGASYGPFSREIAAACMNADLVVLGYSPQYNWAGTPPDMHNVIHLGRTIDSLWYHLTPEAIAANLLYGAGLSVDFLGAPEPLDAVVNVDDMHLPALDYSLNTVYRGVNLWV